MSLRAQNRLEPQQEAHEEQSEQVTKLPPPPLVTVGPLTEGPEEEARPQERPRAHEESP